MSTRRFTAGLGLVISSALGAGVLYLAVHFVMPPSQPPGSINEKEFELLEQTLAALNAGEIEEKAKGAADQPGLIPAGDTCLMRRREDAFLIPRQRRQAHARAALLLDPDHKLVALQYLKSEAESDAELWLLDLLTARTLVRSARPEEALPLIDGLINASGIPEVCLADGLFLKGVVQPETAQEALLQALEFDPAFWNAHVQLIRHLAQKAQTSSCADAAAYVIQSTVTLSQLANNDAQLAHLWRSVTSAQSSPHISAVVRGMVLERTNRISEATQLYRDWLEQPDGDRCTTVVKLAFADRLKHLNEGATTHVQ